MKLSPKFIGRKFSAPRPQVRPAPRKKTYLTDVELKDAKSEIVRGFSSRTAESPEDTSTATLGSMFKSLDSLENKNTPIRDAIVFGRPPSEEQLAERLLTRNDKAKDLKALRADVRRDFSAKKLRETTLRSLKEGAFSVPVMTALGAAGALLFPAAVAAGAVTAAGLFPGALLLAPAALAAPSLPPMLGAVCGSVAAVMMTALYTLHARREFQQDREEAELGLRKLTTLAQECFVAGDHGKTSKIP